MQVVKDQELDLAWYALKARGLRSCRRFVADRRGNRIIFRRNTRTDKLPIELERGNPKSAQSPCFLWSRNSQNAETRKKNEAWRCERALSSESKL